MTNKPTYEELEKQVKALHNEALVLREEKQTIQEQLNLSKIILSATPDLLVLKDRDFVYQAVNPSFCKFLGKTEESIIGKTDFDLFPRFEAEMYRRNDLKVIKTHKPQVQDEEVTGEDEKRWLRVFKTPLLSEKGSSIGVLCSVVDITNRKRAEESLAKAEHEKEIILDSLLEIVVYMDLEMRILWANIAACKSVDLTRDELLGRHCYEIWADSSEPCSECVVVRAIKTGQVREIEKTTPDGRSWFNIGCPVRDKKNTIIGGIEVVLEITERKQAEEALQESEERFKDLANLLPQPVWEMDLEGNFTYSNRAGHENFGYTPKDLEKGVTIADVIATEDRERAVANFRKRLRGTEFENHEYTCLIKDGRKFPALIYSSPIIKDGEPSGVRGVTLDITDRKKAELALTKKGKELENKTHELEEVNAALKVLLKHREKDKKDVEEKVVANVKKLVLPYVEKLNNSRLNDRQIVYLNIIKSNLEDIITPFLHQLSSKYSDLTPSEIQVADLVKEGKTTKEIAELLNSSTGTIDFHRNNLRKKLGLRNTKTNLRSFLLALT
jgi:PAS domain S-box-containing protein